MSGVGVPIERRFWKHVDKSNGDDACWIWTGAKFWFGHGAVKLAGRPWGAHRVSWELAHGPVSTGMNVLHRCDNPPCVNPRHLFVGTQQDNVVDMHQKGRGYRPKRRAA